MRLPNLLSNPIGSRKQVVASGDQIIAPKKLRVNIDFLRFLQFQFIRQYRISMICLGASLRAVFSGVPLRLRSGQALATLQVPLAVKRQPARPPHDIRLSRRMAVGSRGAREQGSKGDKWEGRLRQPARAPRAFVREIAERKARQPRCIIFFRPVYR